MSYIIAEGLGIIYLNNDEDNFGPADLFGLDYEEATTIPNLQHLNYLYQVCDGAGNIIYNNEMLAPGWPDKYFSSLKSLTQDSELRYDGKTVRLAGTEANVYNSQGQLVNRYDSNNGNVTFSTDSYAKGIYIVNCNGKCSKILVK